MNRVDLASRLHAEVVQCLRRPNRRGKRGRPFGARVGYRSQRPSRAKLHTDATWSRKPGRPATFAPSAQDQILDPGWVWLDAPWSPPFDNIPGDLHAELCWLRAQARRPVTPHRSGSLGWVPLRRWRRHFGVSPTSHWTRADMADVTLKRLMSAGWVQVRPGRTASSQQIHVHPALVLDGKPTFPGEPEQDPGPWPADSRNAAQGAGFPAPVCGPRER